MSIQELGSLGEFIASIAVVISLIYLAYQVRQNTRQQRRAEMNAAMQSATEFRSAMLSSDGSDVVFRLLTEPNALSKSDKFKAGFFLDQIFWYAYQTWDREKLGIGSYASWTRGTEPMIRGFKDNEVVIRWWSQNRYQFPEEFTEVIDRTFSRDAE